MDSFIIRRVSNLHKLPLINIKDMYMNRKHVILRSIAGALLFGAGLTTGLIAQALSDAPQRVEQKRADLSGAPNMEVIASTIEFKPGDSSPSHFHHGIEAAYIVQGAMVQYPGKEPVKLATGTTIMNLRDVKHGGFTVVGTDSLKLFAVHVVDKGQPLYDQGN
jgi:quercetin dioxygenase-like cupin family protein